MLPAFWLERGSCPAALHERGLCSGRGIFLYGRPSGYGGEYRGSDQREETSSMTASPVKTQPAARFRNSCPLTELLKRPATRPASSDTQPKTSSVASWNSAPRAMICAVRPPRAGIGELRQESKEEQRHLGVGDIHDHPSPVQRAVSGELRLLERSL